mmetsp:Transcript_12062/g.21417  ORF Transcript_12062/g.21417 Transcript_12062/m.21417 type:complete len:357 (+) Transcript_12062:224-1294(+)
MTMTASSVPMWLQGRAPILSTRKRTGAPLVRSSSLAVPMHASMASWEEVCCMFTPRMQSPKRQPSLAASGLVKFVTTRFSIRRPSDLSSPKSSATTMATLWVSYLLEDCSSPDTHCNMSCTPSAMPRTESVTKSWTKSTASAAPSATALTTPFSAKSSAVLSNPSPTVSTTVVTPWPTMSTASSAPSASSSSAPLVRPKVSVTRPTPPRAAPPTNFVASPIARPAPEMRSSSSSRPCGNSMTCVVPFFCCAHSEGFSPSRTKACARLCGLSSAAFSTRPSGIFSLKPGTSSLERSRRYSAFRAPASVIDVATEEASFSMRRPCSSGQAATLPASAKRSAMGRERILWLMMIRSTVV